MSEELEKKPALRPWIIAYAIVFPPIAFFFNNWHQSLGRWWLFPAIIPLPMIWMLIMFYALEKVSPRFKISQQEMVLFFVINFMVSGSMYAAFGIHYWTSVPLPTWNYAKFIHGKIVEPYRDVFLRELPAFLAPNDVNQLNAFYYGGAFDYGVWLPSMMFWILWAIALYVGSYFWGFLLRKPLIEEERLPFPGIMPTEMIMRYYYEEGERRGLFDIKRIVTKVFWVGFIVGCIVSSPTIINAFLPSPWVWYIHGFEFDWTPFTESFLPGATMGGYFYLTDTVVGQFIPLDVLATGVLWWFAMGVIYQTVGARMGFIPWTPGTTASGTTAAAWTTGPFKWMSFAQFMTLGLGLWVAFMHRRHIINIFKAGLGLDKGLPSGEEGISYRTIVYGGISCLVILIILFLAGGAYAPMAVILPLFYILYMWGWTRMMGEVQEFMPSVGTYSGMAFDMGTALGGWGGRPSPAALNTQMLYDSFGGGARMSSLVMHHHFKSYKLAHTFKTRARDILVVSVITMVTTAVAAYLIWPAWYAAVDGYSISRAIEYHIWELPGPWSYTYGVAPAVGVAETWGLAISATVTAIVIYFLRARFAWFFINPVGMMMLPHWWWPTWLFAFVTKYLVLRIGGARLHDKYVIPLAAGFLAGFGAFVIIASFVMFFTLSVPEFLARIATP